jgi:hypothetical protein
LPYPSASVLRMEEGVCLCKREEAEIGLEE